MYLVFFFLIQNIFSQDTYIVFGDRHYSYSNPSPYKNNPHSEESLKSIDSFSDLFLKSSGYSLTNNGGNKSIYYRGTDPSHLTIIKDGLIQNDVLNPNRQVDFSQISFQNLKSAELLPGSDSSFYGSNSIGGVLLLNTGKKENSVELIHGSKNRASTSVNFYKPFNDGQIYLNSNLSSGEYFSQTSERGKINDHDPNLTISNYLKWESNLNEASEYSLFIDQFSSNQKIDNGALDDDPNDKVLNKYWQLGLNYKYSKIPSSKWHLALGYKNNRRDFFNLSDQDESNNSQTISKSQTGQFHLINTTNLQENIILNSQLNYLNETFNQFKMQTFSLSELVQVYLTENLFQLGARIDHSEEFKREYSFKTSWDYHFSSHYHFFSSLSSGFKAPTLSQLKDPDYGNLNLKSEKSLTAEIGSKIIPLKELELTFSFFQTKVKDLISFHPVTYRSRNEGQALIKGTEFKLILNKEKFIYHHATNYINALNESTRSQLNRRPHLQISNIFQFETYPYLNIIFSHDFKGKRFDDYNGQRKILNERHLFNLKALIHSLGNHSAEFGVDNIFNKDYQDVFGYNTMKLNYNLKYKFIF